LVDMARTDPAAGVVDIASPESRYQESIKRPPRRFGLRMAGACAVVVSIIALWLAENNRGSDAITTYKTAHGQQSVWALPDGSTLHVNTDTAVSVRFSSTERLVEVDHGEIAVDVAHDARRLFRVQAGATDAEAVGTKFDVYREPDSTLISVADGQIAVSVDGPGESRTAARKGMRVSAGEQVRVVAGKLPAAPEPSDAQETTAWLDRRIVFNQRPLSAVAAEFNRYNSVAFTIEDPALRTMPISGAFNATDTESFIAFLKSLDGVQVQRLPTGFDVRAMRGKQAAPDHRKG